MQPEDLVVILGSSLGFIATLILALVWMQWKAVPIYMGILAGNRRIEKRLDESNLSGDDLSRAHVNAITRTPVKERRAFLS